MGFMVVKKKREREKSWFARGPVVEGARVSPPEGERKGVRWRKSGRQLPLFLSRARRGKRQQLASLG